MARTAERVAQSSKASVKEKQAAKLVFEAAQLGNLTVQVVRARHVLGEAVVSILESTLKAGRVEC